MASQIVFKFERGGELVAHLMQDVAPKTVKAVIDALTLTSTSTAFHTRWCGREVYLPIETRIKVWQENATSQTNTGDVVYWKEWEKDWGEDDSAPAEALAMYYGPELLRYHGGTLRANVFARIPQSQWPVIEEIGLRVWQQGVEKVTLSLREHQESG